VCVLAVRTHYFIQQAQRSDCLSSVLISYPKTREGGAKCDYLFVKKQNDVIDNLIETLNDGQEGFKKAAEGVTNPNLKSLFRDYSQQRSRFATALQSEARRQGEIDRETSSSATGALHRGGINLKSVVTGGDEHAILAECERGEDSAVEEYKQALADGLTPSTQELLSRQFVEIKAAHDRIKSLGALAKAN